jgi:hypothetical protein
MDVEVVCLTQVEMTHAIVVRVRVNVRPVRSEAKHRGCVIEIIMSSAFVFSLTTSLLSSPVS